MPSATLTRPAANETLYVGTSYTITWTSSGASNQRLQYSLDGGKNYDPIVTGLGPDANHYDWLVPDGLVAAGGSSVAVTVRLVVKDANNAEATATSAITVANPRISSVSPTSGPLAGGTTIDVRGDGFAPSCKVKVADVDAASAMFIDAGHVTAVTPAVAAAGSVSVRVKNPSAPAAVAEGAFEYRAPASPTIGSLAPNHGAIAGNTRVDVFGKDFDRAANVKFGGADALAITFVDATHLQVTTPAAANMAAGAVDVKVKNPNAPAATLAGGFSYDPPPQPVITSIAPNHGSVGGNTRVDVYGTSFDPACTVKFGGNDAGGALFLAPTHLQVTTPAAANMAPGAVDVKAKNPNAPGFTLAGGFTYDPPPAATLSSLSPSHGPVGGSTRVDVRGSGFDPACTVKFGDNDGTALVFVDATHLQVTTPAALNLAPGAVDVKAKNPGAPASTLARGYTYDPPASPTIGSVAPNHGSVGGGTRVDVFGSAFDPGCTVKFADVDGTALQVLAPTHLQVTTPPAPNRTPATVDVKVKNPSAPAAVLTGGFSYDPPPAPTISGVSPNHGPLGGNTRVDVYGSGFDPACTVKFGDADGGAPQVIDPGHLQATAPPAANMTPGLVDVKVKNPGVPAVTASGAYRYDAPVAPTVSSIAPNHGPLAGGTRVDLLGKDFAPGCGVKFGGNDAAVTFFDATHVQATTPAGARAGSADVTVKNPGAPAVTVAAGYSYDAPPAGVRIDSITPAHAPATRAITVVIAGAGFAAGCRVSFGGNDAAGVKVDSPAQLTVTTPAPVAGGPARVKVVNPDSTSFVLDGAFTFDPPPSVTRVDPPAGPKSAQPELVVNVFGTGFRDGATVSFGGVASPKVVLAKSDGSQLAATLPPAPAAGVVTVKVQNPQPDGQVGKLDGAFTYLGPKQAEAARIFSVSPKTVVIGQDTLMTVKGRNLGTAIAQGLFAVRGPNKAFADIRIHDRIVKPIPSAQEDEVQFYLTISRAPLSIADRVPFTVVASVRRNSRKNRIPDTGGKATFTLVTNDLPVAFGITAQLLQGAVNVILLAGRNLKGSSLAVSDTKGSPLELSYTHVSAGADVLVAGLTLRDTDANGGANVRVIGPGGPVGDPIAIEVMPPPPDPTSDDDVPLGKLKTAPGQRLMKFPAGSIGLFALDDGPDGGSWLPGDPDFSGPEILYRPVLATIDQFVIQLVDESLLVPAFARSGKVTVGRFLKLRGVPLLIHLEVTLVVTISVFVFQAGDPFADEPIGPFNDFPELPGYGAFLVSVDVQIDILIAFLLAILLPNDQIVPLLFVAIDFKLDVSKRSLTIGTRVLTAHILSIRPIAGTPRLLLAAPQPADPPLQDVASYFGYFFPIARGRGCADFDFRFSLASSFLDGGDPEPVEDSELVVRVCVEEKAPVRRSIRVHIEPNFLNLKPGEQGTVFAKDQDGNTLAVPGVVRFAPDPDAAAIVDVTDQPASNSGLVKARPNAKGSGMVRALAATDLPDVSIESDSDVFVIDDDGTPRVVGDMVPVDVGLDAAQVEVVLHAAPAGQADGPPLARAWVYWIDTGMLIRLRSGDDGRLLQSQGDASRPESYRLPFRSRTGIEVDVLYTTGALPLPDDVALSFRSSFAHRKVAVTTEQPRPTAVIAVPQVALALTQPQELSIWPLLYELPALSVVEPLQPDFQTDNLPQGAALFNGVRLAITEYAPPTAAQQPRPALRPRQRGLLVAGTCDAAVTTVRVRLLDDNGRAVGLRATRDATDRVTELTVAARAGSFQLAVYLAAAAEGFGLRQLVIVAERGKTGQPPLIGAFAAQLVGLQIALADDFEAKSDGRERGRARTEADELVIVDFLHSPGMDPNPAVALANLVRSARARRMVRYGIGYRRRPLAGLATTAQQPEMPLWMVEMQLLGLSIAGLTDLLIRRREFLPGNPTTLRLGGSTRLEIAWHGPDGDGPANNPSRNHILSDTFGGVQTATLRIDGDRIAGFDPKTGAVDGALDQPPQQLGYPVTDRRLPAVVIDGQLRRFGFDAAAPDLPTVLIELQPAIRNAARQEVIRGGNGQLDLSTFVVDGQRVPPGLIVGAGGLQQAPDTPITRLPTFRVRAGVNISGEEVRELREALVEQEYDRRPNDYARALSLACWQETVRRIFRREAPGQYNLGATLAQEFPPAISNRAFDIYFGQEQGMPTFGGPHGYGQGQIDKPRATDDQVWSVVENIRAAIVLLFDDKARGAYGAFSYLFGNPAVDQHRARAIYQREIVRRYNGGTEFVRSGANDAIIQPMLPIPRLIRYPNLLNENPPFGTAVAYRGVGVQVSFVAANYGPETQ